MTAPSQATRSAADMHDTTTEKAVLGCMMLSRRAALLCLERLGEADFSNPVHATIFRAARAITETRSPEGRPVEPAGVVGWLKERGLLDAVGGIFAVFNLPETQASSAAVGEYVDRLKMWTSRRQLARVVAETSEAMDRADPSELSAAIAGAALAITAPTGKAARLDIELMSAWDDVTQATPYLELPDFGLHLHNGSLTVIGARPTVGKTAYGTALAVAWGSDEQRVRFYSYEMSADILRRRIIAGRSRFSVAELDDGLTDDESKEVAADTAGLLEPGRHVEILEAAHLTFDALIANMRTFAAQGGRAVIIDYLGLAVPPGPKRYEEVTKATRQLKLTALSTGLVVVVLSQLSRGPAREDGTLRPPVLTDLRESGSVEQDADNVVLLHRFDTTGDRFSHHDKELLAGFREAGLRIDVRHGGTMRDLCMIEVAKARNGKNGCRPAFFNGPRLTFEPVAGGGASIDRQSAAAGDRSDE